MHSNKIWPRILWVLVLVTCVLYISKNFKIESSILKLLPKYEAATTNAFIEKATEKVNKQVVLLASSEHKNQLLAEFKQQLQQLQESALIQSIEYQVNPEKFIQVYQLLSPFRHNLLSFEDKKAFETEMGDDYFIHQAQQSLYGLQQASYEQLLADPLFIFQRYLMGFSQLNVMSFDSSEQYFLVNKNGQHHMAAFVELKDSAFAPANQAQFVTALNEVRQQLTEKQIDLSAFGSVLYAHQAYQDAKHEISTVGLGSLIGIVLLILLVFRSPFPLLFSLLSIGLGLLVALAVTLAVYGYVHAFAMVFGATIAGVSIDYCFHYLTESALLKSAEQKVTPQMVLTKIRSALLIGFLSSATVYLAFMVTGYEVLGQISVFSVCGLAAVLLNVLLIFPYFYQAKAIKQQQQFLVFTGRWLNNPLQQVFQNVWLVLLILAALLAVSVMVVKPNDDVRALQKLSPKLKQQEQHIKQVLSWQQGNAFVLITAPSLSAVISKEQALLNDWRNQSDQPPWLENLVGVSDFIPNVEQQQKNFKHIQSLLQSTKVKEFLTELGLDVITPEAMSTLTVNVLKQPILQQLFKQRLLGQAGQQQALLLPLGQSASNIDFPENSSGLLLVQQAEDTSELFAQFRYKSSWVLALTVVLLVMLLAVFRYSSLEALHLVALPLLAGFMSLVLAALLGYHISMFSILAMLLVLGMGLDYVVFLRESQQPSHVMLALLLSATTTILAFGLLSFSKVAVLQSFGFMVGVGIFVVLCLSPAILVWTQNKSVKGGMNETTV